MRDTIYGNKEILEANTRAMPHIKRSWNSMVKPNCKILFPTAARGNITATWDFLYLKGCISAYFVLFLDLGQITLPCQTSQLQLRIRLQLCTFGDLGPSPTPLPGPRGAEAHTSINPGIRMTPGTSDSLHSCSCCWSLGETLQQAAVASLPGTRTQSSVSRAAVLGNWYFLSALQSLPILFYWFLLVSTFGKKRRIKRPTRFQHSFTANAWFTRKINQRKPIKPRVWWCFSEKVSMVLQ